jgi:DNA repair protein RecO (recombination protein O)
MAVEKTNAVILKLMPYRESSGILYLLTEHHGIIHGIAKGLRKQKPSTTFFERGFLIECLLYTKPHRDLHTISDMSVVQFYPILRTHLLAGALRDTAFETILKTISSAYPYPELYSLVVTMLTTLNTPAAQHDLCAHLLWFFRDFVALIGFELNRAHCLACSKPLSEATEGAYLLIEKGGFVCRHCSPLNNVRNYLTADMLEIVVCPNSSIGFSTRISTAETLNLIKLLTLYCQYHSDTGGDRKSLLFLESLLQ